MDFYYKTHANKAFNMVWASQVPFLSGEELTTAELQRGLEALGLSSLIPSSPCTAGLLRSKSGFFHPFLVNVAFIQLCFEDTKLQST